MATRLLISWCAVVTLSFIGRGALSAEPRVSDNRYKLELVAQEPQIVTPIGMAFDRKGRLLVVESHTHQRPKDYTGPPADRIQMLSDSDGDGRLGRWTTFAQGFRHAMNLLVREDGAVYLVTRRSVLLLRDTDNDGVADKQDEILRLETADDYPHNALSGIAIEPGDKTMLISMGENHGAFYRLIGSDEKKLTGQDGAGTVFRCTLDGRELRRVAVGFWNPFSICVVPDGRIFAVDNDPDASPPCRMVHVIEGADYGFRYEYGRAGTHPLQAWNGELPGTLPYVIGVGEAPTAVVPHAGGLFATSWGDHRIDRYELVPRGTSYGAKREIIVQGDADFRPTGMAVAPDGSLYFADWVLRNYPVHGRGRIWRLTLPKEDVKKPFPAPSKDDVAAQADPFAAPGQDPFVQARRVWQQSQRPGLEHDALSLFSPSFDRHPPSGALPQTLQALRLHGLTEEETLQLLRNALKNESSDVRLLAVRWIADERIVALRPEAVKLLEGPQPSQRYYLAVLGAIDWLARKPELRGTEIADELLVRELTNAKRTPEARALALALVKPDNKFLTIDKLNEYMHSDHVPLRLEAARSLAEQTNSKRFDLLAEVARDESQGDEVRAEAIVGLSGAAKQNRDLLEKLAGATQASLRQEAKRALRLAGLDPAPTETKPAADDIGAWSQLLKTPGDAAAGRRLFFSPVAARCSVCHKYGGRGGNVGPDLTETGRSTLREKLLASILQPSQEIAPDYQSWTLITIDGKTYAGLRLPKPGDDGKEDYIDSAGKIFMLPSSSIEERRVSSTSIMPDNLQSVLSIGDLRDLLTFLTAERPVP